MQTASSSLFVLNSAECPSLRTAALHLQDRRQEAIAPGRGLKAHSTLSVRGTEALESTSLA